MPDFYNNEIDGLDYYRDDTDISFVCSGVTSLVLGPTSANFNVPLIGDGSGLTGITTTATFTGGTVNGPTIFTNTVEFNGDIVYMTDYNLTGSYYGFYSGSTEKGSLYLASNFLYLQAYNNTSLDLYSDVDITLGAPNIYIPTSTKTTPVSGDKVYIGDSASFDVLKFANLKTIDGNLLLGSGNISTRFTGGTVTGATIFTNGLTITANTSTDALTITNVGTGNSLLIEDSASPDSTPFVIDNIGRVGFGLTTPSAQLHGIGSVFFDNYANPQQTVLRRANGTATAPTALLNSQVIGLVGSRGYDGTSFTANNTGLMRFISDEAWSTTANGTRIDFQLVPNSSTTLTTVVTIKNEGSVGIGTTTPTEKLDVVGNVKATSFIGIGSGLTGVIAAAAYTLSVQALTSTPADNATIYFGQLPKAPTTTANISKVYIPKTGTIKRANIYCYAGTAGTAENWSAYIRKNNTTDTLIETIGAATNERVFNNEALSIAVTAGDYIEIKMINPTWATNPATAIFGGYIYIEG
jgi:hypothetical protein